MPRVFSATVELPDDVDLDGVAAIIDYVLGLQRKLRPDRARIRTDVAEAEESTLAAARSHLGGDEVTAWLVSLRQGRGREGSLAVHFHWNYKVPGTKKDVRVQSSDEPEALGVAASIERFVGSGRYRRLPGAGARNVPVAANWRTWWREGVLTQVVATMIAAALLFLGPYLWWTLWR